RRRFGTRIVAGQRQVRAVGADTETAGLLRVAVGTPVLVLEGTSTDGAARPVEVFRTWHRADRVVFDVAVLDEPAPAGPEPAAPDLRARLESLAAELQAVARELD